MKTETRLNFYSLSLKAVITFGLCVFLLVASTVVTIERDKGLAFLIVFSVVATGMLGGRGAYWLFGVGRKVEFVDGGAVLRVLMFVGWRRFGVGRIERVEVCASTADDHEGYVAWRLVLRGRRLAVFVDERADGFELLEQELRERQVPIVKAPPSRVREDVMCLVPHDPTLGRKLAQISPG